MRSNAFGLSLVAGLLLALTGCGSKEAGATGSTTTNADLAGEPAAVPPAERSRTHRGLRGEGRLPDNLPRGRLMERG